MILFKNFHFKVFLNLIRALFPVWSFFDQTAYTFELHFLLPETHEWKRISFVQTLTPINIFFNPQVNEALAQFNIVEHFAKDIMELQKTGPSADEKKIRQLTSFLLLRSLVFSKVSDLGYLDKTIQFKIVALNTQNKFDIYTSEWMSK